MYFFTVRDHFSPKELAKIEKADKTVLEKLWGKIYTWWEYKKVQPLFGNNYQTLQIHVSFMPAIPILSIHRYTHE